MSLKYALAIQANAWKGPGLQSEVINPGMPENLVQFCETCFLFLSDAA
ncbi:MAG TPA: hypothetical protein VN277_01140 [Acidiferrobacterales bacterium]|nr:hypothetical protein [Acidiferrobacterales bacterium]